MKDVYLVILQTEKRDNKVEGFNYEVTNHRIECYTDYEKAKAYINSCVDAQLAIERNTCEIVEKFDMDSDEYELPPVFNGWYLVDALYSVVTKSTFQGAEVFMSRFIIKSTMN